MLISIFGKHVYYLFFLPYHFQQREFTNDCIFNERLEDNYNYYTSTHHSTALRTYYVALNRLGVSRKTYLPSNKPLGKLSTYTKAFTFIVPEHRSEYVIGKRFGFNHVKHGIKHLCESGKELMRLSEKQLFVPECIVGSASNDNVNIANSSSLSKKQSYHIRHVNTNNNHRSPPAPLIDRSTNNKNKIPNPAPTKAAICIQEPCPKKKKSHNNGGNRNGGHNKKDNKKIHQKNAKTKTNRRPHNTRAITTTTENIIRPQETHVFSDSEIENIDDESIESFVPVPITSNGYAAITNDEDYDNVK